MTRTYFFPTIDKAKAEELQQERERAREERAHEERERWAEIRDGLKRNHTARLARLSGFENVFDAWSPAERLKRLAAWRAAQRR
jgi:hypothetical protein